MSIPGDASTAIVTVSYNSSQALAHFLPSVVESAVRGDAVLVVDNASADIESTRALCRELGVHLLELPRNIGYGGAANAGVRELPQVFDRVLVSNPDVVVDDSAVAGLSAALDSRPHIGAVGPLVRNADGSTYPSARSLPSLRSGVGHALFARVWPGNPWSRRYHADREHSDADREAGWLSGSCLLVRREAFESIGGFDESFFMYFEDVDLGYRLGKQGWANLYHPASAVTHTGAHSTKQQPANMIRAHHASAARYLDRRYRGATLAPLRWALRLGLKVRAASEIRRIRRADQTG